MKKQTLTLLGCALILISTQSIAASETALPLNFQVQAAANPWNVQQSEASARFELRPGDRAQYDEAGKERAELATTQPLLFDHTYNLSFRMKIEPGEDNKAKWLLFLQLQSTFEKGQPGHSPPFAMELAGEQLRIVRRSGTNPVINNQGFDFKEIYHGRSDLTRGRWYDFRVKFRFNADAEGSAQVWQDGTLIVDYSGPLGFPDKNGPIIRYGLYRSASDGTIAVQFADFHLTE